MMNIAKLVDQLRSDGMDDREIDLEIRTALSEEEEAFLEDYYNDPIVQYGWHQQDIIDMYRRER